MYRNPDVRMAGTQPAWLGSNAFDKSIKLLPNHDAIWKPLRCRMKRMRFSYDYSIELSRRRLARLPSMTPKQYPEHRNTRRIWVGWNDPIDTHARGH
ncbi:MAG: hypothetical protein GY880_16660 [Planctomycetaceae bacterium]|nr:hypothetical protein [Planctomycetaceae bacterium]